MILLKNNYYEEDERFFSTGNEELDDILTEVYYSGIESGYEYAQREFTSKATKKLRRKLLIDAADNSFEKEEATRLLEAGKIDQKEWNRRVIAKGKERLGIERPVVSDGGFTINLENIPTKPAGNVNYNAKNAGQFATKGKSRAEKRLLKAKTNLSINDYRNGGMFGTIDTSENLQEIVDKSSASDIQKKRMKKLINKGKEALNNEERDLVNKVNRAEKLVKAGKIAKKAAPWVLGTTAIAGAAVGSAKIYKKKKSNKKD